jgi:tetratricopeptide (TPR) repeat protein
MFDLASWDKILVWQADLAQRFPGVSLYRLQTASSHLTRGIDYWLRESSFPKASQHLESTRAILEHSSPTETTHPDVQNTLGHALRDLANAQRDLDSYSTAERHYRRALDLHEKLVVRHPTRPQYQLNLGWDCWELCRYLLRVGRYDEAEPLSARAVAIFEGLSSDYPDAPAYGMYRAFALAERAGSLMRTGRSREADAVIGRIEGLENRTFTSGCLSQIAWYAAQDVGPGRPDPSRAAELARKAIALSPDSSEAWHTLGQAHFRAGDWDAAITALEHIGTSPPPGHVIYRVENGPAYGGFFLAMAYQKRGDRALARSRYDRSVAWMTEHERRDPILVRYRAEAASLLAVDLPQGDRRPEAASGPPSPPQ